MGRRRRAARRRRRGQPGRGRPGGGPAARHPGRVRRPGPGGRSRRAGAPVRAPGRRRAGGAVPVPDLPGPALAGGPPGLAAGRARARHRHPGRRRPAAVGAAVRAGRAGRGRRGGRREAGRRPGAGAAAGPGDAAGPGHRGARGRHLPGLRRRRGRHPAGRPDRAGAGTDAVPRLVPGARPGRAAAAAGRPGQPGGRDARRRGAAGPGLADHLVHHRLLHPALGQLPEGDVLGRPHAELPAQRCGWACWRGWSGSPGCGRAASAPGWSASLDRLRADGLAALDPRTCGTYAPDFHRDSEVRPFAPDREIRWVWGWSLRDSRAGAGAGGADLLPARRAGCGSGSCRRAPTAAPPAAA